jgi:hypothetical protein
MELPTRIAHRLRDMQTLPYQALTNKHIGHVYELYYAAFEQFRKVPEIRTLDDNDRFCQVIKTTLNQHLTVIPHLAIGVLEIQGSVKSEQCDRFMNTLLRSRISRRVIAEQHLALTDTFHSPWHFPDAKKSPMAPEDDFIGEIFLRCNARELIEKCADIARAATKQAYGLDVVLPEIVVKGHLDITFPYIPSHLEYIIGELLRNSIQSTVETFSPASPSTKPPPIEVLVCEAPQHIIIRVSDQAGGVDPEVLPYLWSFAKGPRKSKRLRNLNQVPRLAATPEDVVTQTSQQKENVKPDSLSPITARSADLKLGIGLPMSRIYAEYWAGNLELHSLEGYGSDAFLQISRLGNKNEVLSTRAMMDAV